MNAYDISKARHTDLRREAADYRLARKAKAGRRRTRVVEDARARWVKAA